MYGKRRLKWRRASTLELCFDDLANGFLADVREKEASFSSCPTEHSLSHISSLSSSLLSPSLTPAGIKNAEALDGPCDHRAFMLL